MVRVVHVEDGCWEWLGSRTPTGYGTFKWQGRTSPAHRWMWRVLRGEIPSGLELDHLCRNRGCVNPEHLEPVTHDENVRRSLPFVSRGQSHHNGGKTHCPNGHPLSGDNLYLDRKGKQRMCRACRAQRMAEYRERQRNRGVCPR